jgi:hypothetical protein
MARKLELPIEGKPWHGIPYPEPPPPLNSLQDWLQWQMPRMLTSRTHLPWYIRLKLWWQARREKLMGEQD